MEIIENPKVDLTGYIKKKFESALFNDENSCEFYTSEADEYNSIKYGVAVRNISDSVFLELTGNDCVHFLDRITTNNLTRVEPEHVVKTLFCNSQGLVLDEVVLLPMQEHHLLIRSRDDKKIIKRWIDNYIVGEDVKINEPENKYSLFELYGPQSKTYLSIICGHDVEKLKNHKMNRFLIDDFEIMVIKLIDKVEKYWVLFKDKGIDKVFDFLFENKSVLDFSFLGEKAYTVYRIENGISMYPQEYNGKLSPFGLKLSHLVDFKKKGYLGHDKLVPYLSGEQKIGKLCLLSIPADLNLELPYIITEKEEQVGIITSQVKSLKDETKIALSLLEESADQIIIDQKECKILKEF